jgi:hypothetical protein
VLRCRYSCWAVTSRERPLLPPCNRQISHPGEQRPGAGHRHGQPNHAGQRVWLQRLVDGAWKTAATATLSSGSGSALAATQTVTVTHQ